jgi:hypothetical protein
MEENNSITWKDEVMISTKCYEETYRLTQDNHVPDEFVLRLLVKKIIEKIPISQLLIIFEFEKREGFNSLIYRTKLNLKEIEVLKKYLK